MAHILIIEHDELIAAMERDFLLQADFTVSVARTAKEGVKALRGAAIDAIILTCDLPDMDGLSLCKRIRETKSIPILFISSRTGDDDVVAGLEAGADDYIKKPFNPTEMVARLKAHIRIHDMLATTAPQEKDETLPDIESGDLKIYINRHQVFRGNHEINLTGKEFSLLVFLAQHPNEVLSKKCLFEKIWHLDALGEMATVTVHVNRLRDKLNEVQPEFTAIETVWCNGYRFRKDD